eukprot:scaffold122_cov387-Prasinococcus_capsulatus_cf.AAC.3
MNPNPLPARPAPCSWQRPRRWESGRRGAQDAARCATAQPGLASVPTPRHCGSRSCAKHTYIFSRSTRSHGDNAPTRGPARHRRTRYGVGDTSPHSRLIQWHGTGRATPAQGMAGVGART